MNSNKTIMFFIKRTALACMTCAAITSCPAITITAPSNSWQLTKLTLVQWYGIGFAAKLIMNYVIESLELQHQQSLDKKFEQEKSGLTDQQLQERRLHDHSAMDEFKARMDAAEKILETALQGAAGTFYSAAGAPKNMLTSVTNAYEAGEKWSLLSKVTKNMPLLELVGKRVHDEAARYYFELIPIKPTHSTALYCGPKDPHCIHGIQAPITFIDTFKDFFSTSVRPWFNMIVGVVAGVLFSNLGYHLGKTATTATSALSQKLIWLAKDFGLPLLAYPTLATLFQKGMARYIEVKTINELKELLMNVVEGINLTKERINAEKRIKWGSQAKIIEAQTIPTYQKFLNDLTLAS